MARRIELADIEEILTELNYPTTSSVVAAECEDVIIELADGEVTLGDVIADSPVDRYESVADLASDVRSNLPRRAVGEPYQSEGEG